VDRVDGAALDPRQPVLRERPGRALPTSEPAEVADRPEQRRKGAPRGVVERAVRPQKAAAADADLGPRVHQLEEPVERAVEDAGVGVQRQHVLAVAAPDGEVRRSREAEVARSRHEVDPGELAAYQLDGAVARRVVDHEDAQRTQGWALA